MMKGLLIKDITISKKEFIYSIIGCAFALFVMVVSALGMPDEFGELYKDEAVTLLFIPNICAPAMLIHTLLSDEKCGYLSQAFSAPLLRKDYVKEKYIFAFINMLIFLIPSVLLIAVAVCFSGKGFNSGDLQTFALAMGLFILAQVFAFTFMLCFYMKKGGNMIIAALAITMIGSWTIFSFITGFMKGFTEGMGAPEVFRTFVIVLVLVLAVLEAFMFIMSFKWAEKKEL